MKKYCCFPLLAAVCLILLCTPVLAADDVPETDIQIGINETGNVSSLIQDVTIPVPENRSNGLMDQIVADTVRSQGRTPENCSVQNTSTPSEEMVPVLSEQTVNTEPMPTTTAPTVPSVVSPTPSPEVRVYDDGFIRSAPLNPAFVEWQKQQQEGTESCSGEGCRLLLASATASGTECERSGLIPSPLMVSARLPDSSALTLTSPLAESAGDSAYLTSAPVITTPPSRYDLRDYDRVTPVKNQGTCGSCWAFGALASLESFLKGEAETRDFSENNMKNTHGFVPSCCAGGNRDMATAYLTRWDVPDGVSWYAGPVNESDDPYNPISCVSPADPLIQKQVQEVFFLPDQPANSNDLVKEMIMTYGAAFAGVDWNDTTALNMTNPVTASYYFNTSEGMVKKDGHGITIVGWDDSWSKTNFNVQPPGDGAYIVKNSWGSGWGDDGYFYISYYDQEVGKELTLFTAEDLNTFDTQHSYDPFGQVGQLGSGPVGKFANVFTTGDSVEILAAVSFYTMEADASYIVNVYLSPDNPPLNTTGETIANASGTIALPGYHTILLDESVSLAAGSTFSVVVEVTNPSSFFTIPVEWNQDGYLNAARASPGEGYLYYGGNWIDATTLPMRPQGDTSICIKAFTTFSPPPEAHFSALPTSGTAPLTVQFNDTSTGDPTSWFWEFGDLENATVRNPVHTFAAPGIYNVTLTVANAGGSDTMTRPGYINASQGEVHIVVKDRNATMLVADEIRFGESTVTNVSELNLTADPGTYELMVSKTGLRSVDTNLSVVSGSENFTVKLSPDYVVPVLAVGEGDTSLSAMTFTPAEQLNALRNEIFSYTVPVLSCGQGLVAWDVPVRTQSLSPTVLFDGETVEFSVENGTFTGSENGVYTTVNGSIFAGFDAGSGNHTLFLQANGGKLGDVDMNSEVTSTDALYILHYTVGNIEHLTACDYADTYRNGKITATDALYVLHYMVGNLNEYYESV